MGSAVDQAMYQVRAEWGSDGVRRLAPADVVIVVDVLAFSSRVVDALDAGEAPRIEDVREEHGAVIAEEAETGDALVLVGAPQNAAAVARTVLEVQDRRQRRTSVAVIAAGEPAADGALRFAVEDHLGAGTIIGALVALGIDHISPEAAVAAEAARGLKNALRHLISASGSARERTPGDPLAASVALDSSPVVPVLRAGSFHPFSLAR